MAKGTGYRQGGQEDVSHGLYSYGTYSRGYIVMAHMAMGQATTLAHVGVLVDGIFVLPSVGSYNLPHLQPDPDRQCHANTWP